MASRAVVVPLVRTADRERANADPLGFAAWPYERPALVDDLWALALAHLPALPAFDSQVGQRARLADRAINPRRLGFILGKLRVARGRVNGKQARQWVVTRADLERWAVSYGMRGAGFVGRHCWGAPSCAPYSTRPSLRIRADTQVRPNAGPRRLHCWMPALALPRRRLFFASA